MAKKVSKREEQDKSNYVDFSGFGTKPDKVVKKVGTVVVGDRTFHDVVVAQDEKGFYTTTMEYVCSSVLDPYRCYRRTLLGNADEIMKEEEQIEAIKDRIDTKEEKVGE